MASHAAAGTAAAAASCIRANSLSRFFASVTPPPKQKPKSKRSPTPKPPAAAAADSVADNRPPKPLGAQPAADAPVSGADHKLKKPFKAILKGLRWQRDPDKLVSEFVEASTLSSRFRDRHRIYEVAVNRLAYSGRQDGIEAIIDAQKPFLETSTEEFAARLIRLYGRASMPSHAAATFRQLPAQHKSTMTFNAVLSAYAEAGEFDGVVAAFQEIPASHPLVVPCLYSYNILIRALCQKPDLSAALDTLQLMEKHGVSPDVITFSTLLNGFYNHGSVGDADALWDTMKERNLEPDAKCYNAKLRGLVAEGRIDYAAAVVDKLEKDGPKPDTVSYNELIRGYCNAGRLQDAKKVYDNLITINEYTPNKGAYGTLVPRLLQAGDLDCALRYCQDLLTRKGVRVAAGLLQDVVDALVEASRVEEATKLVELRQKHYPRGGLRMPHTTEDSGLGAETDEEESISSEEKEHEVKDETGK